jgi:hypothetical protein
MLGRSSGYDGLTKRHSGYDMSKKSISEAARALPPAEELRSWQPKILRPCQKWRKMFSAHELRKHKHTHL